VSFFIKSILKRQDLGKPIHSDLKLYFGTDLCFILFPRLHHEDFYIQEYSRPFPVPRLPLNSVDYSVLRMRNNFLISLRRFDDGASRSQTLMLPNAILDEVCKTIHHYLLIQISWKANGHIAFRRMA